MCIVLLTTAHPDYALVLLDNRDEFILRPTSQPHWWSSHGQEILCSRDLQREEQGTWMGITKTGKLAVLTNYRETTTEDAEHPISGARSRGGMVTAWLTSPEAENTEDFVQRLLKGDGFKGVGGFSLLCGKLRRRAAASTQLDPLAIISNRSGSLDEVPWIAEKPGEVYGLSNTTYSDPEPWPKVQMGKEKLLKVVQEASESRLGEDALVDKLFAILDTDTLPAQAGRDFEDFVFELRKSILIPPIGKADAAAPTPMADAIAGANPSAIHGMRPKVNGHVEAGTPHVQSPSPAPGGGMTGIYGTQRQTIILVGWDGKVSFRERSLWDARGKALPRGEADVKFEFRIEGWE